MAVNLRATATLNIKPYMASLATLSKAHTKLNTGVATGGAAGSKASTDKTIREAAAREAAARTAVASAIDKQSAANARLAASQSSVAKGGVSVASGLAAQRYMFHDLSRQLMTTSLLLAAMPVAALAFAASWEKTFADVVRTADPAFSRVETRVEALRSSLVGMAQAMPIAFKDIAEIATLANQMGIASAQTADFTRAVAMFSATSGVSVDITATAFGRLTSIMGDSRIGFMEMADSILKVGVNSVATEAEIINITTQISSIAQQAGMSTKDIIGLSGALASVRVPPELSRGVVTRVFGQIDKAVNAGGTGLDTLARISGRSSEQFRKDWGTEASAGMFNDFLRGLRDAGSAARSELNSLGVTSVRDVPVILRLANAADSDGNVGELLSQTMRDANNAAGETQRQYTIMADTVVSKLKVLGNNIMAFFDGVGRSGLGVFGDMIESASKSIRNFTRSLEEPHFLMGMFGQTNSDVLGWAVSIGLALAAVTALGSGLAKILSAMAAFSQVKGLLASGALVGFGGRAGAAGAGLGVFATNAGKAATGAGIFGRAAGALGAILTPATLGIAAGVTTLAILNSKMAEGATDAKDLAESLATIDVSNMDSLDRVLSNISVKGPAEFGGWEMNTKPFEDGVESFRGAFANLMDINDRNQYSFFGKPQTFAIGEWLDRTYYGAWDDAAAIGAVDESLQHLADSGNGFQAIKMMEQLAGSGTELRRMLDFDEMANSRDILKNAFDLAGIKMTDENLTKFTRGTLHELYDAMTGIAGSSLNADQLFEGDFERLGEFAKKFDDAAAAFINFESSLADATLTNKDGVVTGFDLGAWADSMDAQVKAQEDWISNITEIMKHGSADVIDALAEMGPAGELAAAELAEGLAKGEPLAIRTLAALEATVLREAEGFGNEVAEMLANIDWVREGSISDGVFDKLVDTISHGDISRLREAGQGLGREAIEGVLEELSKTGDIDAALKALALEQPKIAVSVEFTESGIDNGIAGLQARLRRENPKVTVNLDSESTVADLRSIIDDPTLNEIVLAGNLTLTEAYEQSREFQIWAAENGVDMFLGLNDTPARVTLATMVALGNEQISMMQLDALPDLVKEEIWQTIQYANGQTAFVKLHGDKGEVIGDIAYVVDEATGTVATIPLTGENIDAIEAVEAVGDKAGNTVARINITADDRAAWAALNELGKAKTSSTHTVYTNVVSTHTPDGLYTGGGRMSHADGAVVSYYAEGGVRENHIAQIAPAGAMRVWAEPETGGEAYIPLSQSKRARSEAILDDVASRFGYSLAPQNYTKYADGGYYMAQAMSRQRVAPSVRGSDQGAKVQVGTVTFANSSQKDQFRELTRTLNRVARGL